MNIVAMDEYWAEENGALYAELNFDSNDCRLRFWKSVDFIEPDCRKGVRAQ